MTPWPFRALPLPRSLTVLAFAIVIIGTLAGWLEGGGQDLFVTDDDAQWTQFLRDGCDLIVGVPIVGKAAGYWVATAALSSIIGRYEKQFPILGPPQPLRIANLMKQSLGASKEPNERQAAEIATALYGVEEESAERFFEFARGHADAAEGVVRAYFLQERQLTTPDKLHALARSRGQAVSIDRPRTHVTPALVTALKEKKLAFVAHDPTRAYLAVGYHRDPQLVVVIDPETARSVRIPATQTLLSPQDLASSGMFATRAREILQDQSVTLEEDTRCGEPRPAGLRFARLGVLTKRADVYVIDRWSLDMSTLSGLRPGARR